MEPSAWRGRPLVAGKCPALAHLSAQMKRLPRGHHSLPPEAVAQNQRDRIVAAITESLHERGCEKTTVSVICRSAHVSKSDFYRLFGSKDECFSAAYEVAAERLRAEVVAACAERGDWAQGVCAALASALAFLAREPACASLLLVEGLRGGRGLHDRFQQALGSFVPDLRDGAPAAANGARPPGAADEAVVGGIASLLGRHVVDDEAERLEEFFPDIAEFALTPYVGPVEARRIISAA